MSALNAVRAALETALNGMSPSLATAWENANYSPVTGTPYQRVFLLAAEPDNPEMGRLTIEQGILQVSLAYPLGTGSAAAEARAELIRSTFYRGASFTASGVTTIVEKTPEIAPALIEPDRYVRPVKIRWRAQTAT